MLFRTCDMGSHTMKSFLRQFSVWLWVRVMAAIVSCIRIKWAKRKPFTNKTSLKKKVQHPFVSLIWTCLLHDMMIYYTIVIRATYSEIKIHYISINHIHANTHAAMMQAKPKQHRTHTHPYPIRMQASNQAKKCQALTWKQKYNKSTYTWADQEWVELQQAHLADPYRARHWRGLRLQRQRLRQQQQRHWQSLCYLYQTPLASRGARKTAVLICEGCEQKHLEETVNWDTAAKLLFHETVSTRKWWFVLNWHWVIINTT